MTAGKKKNSAGSMKKHIANAIVAPVQIVLHAPANAGQLSKIIDLYLLRTAMAGLTLGHKTIERIAKDLAAYLVDISAQALSDAFALVEPSFQENFAAEVVAREAFGSAPGKAAGNSASTSKQEQLFTADKMRASSNAARNEGAILGVAHGLAPQGMQLVALSQRPRSRSRPSWTPASRPSRRPSSRAAQPSTRRTSRLAMPASGCTSRRASLARSACSAPPRTVRRPRAPICEY